MISVETTSHDLGALDPATHAILWVDGVGGFLVCLGQRVTLGRLTAEAPVDVALLADVSRHHATIQRDTEGYFLEAIRPVQINGQPRERAYLHSGDRLTLGSACQLQFSQPAAISTSARLDVVSGQRFVRPVQGVLLMADTLLIGPGGHVPVPGMTQPLIVYRTRTGLCVRWPGEFQIDGQTVKERGPLNTGSSVSTEQVAISLERA